MNIFKTVLFCDHRTPTYIMKTSTNNKYVLPINDPRLSYALGFVYLMGIFVHTFFLIAFWKFEVKEMQYINFFSPIAYGLAFFLNKKNKMVFAASLAVSEAVIHGILSLIFVGWEANFHLYVLLVYMLVFFLYNLHIFIRIGIALIITIAYAGCYIFAIFNEPIYDLPRTFIVFSGVFNIISNAGILSIFAITYSHFISKNVNILREAEEQQRKLNAQKNRFFSIFSHDLKNPVTSLHGFVDLMLHRYDSIKDDKRKEYLVQIQNTVNDLNKLIKGLLEWSKSQLDNVKVYPEEINVFQRINDVKSLLDHHALSKEIKLELDIDTGATVYADKQMFNSIMRNIVSNAIKFTPHGGKVTVEAGVENNTTKLIVSDTGIGIHPDNHDSLFKIDKKIISRGTDNETGTGLGLVVAKEFIEKNNGSISFKSVLNEGTSFIIFLPATIN